MMRVEVVLGAARPGHRRELSHLHRQAERLAPSLKRPGELAHVGVELPSAPAPSPTSAPVPAPTAAFLTKWSARKSGVNPSHSRQKACIHAKPRALPALTPGEPTRHPRRCSGASTCAHTSAARAGVQSACPGSCGALNASASRGDGSLTSAAVSCKHMGRTHRRRGSRRTLGTRARARPCSPTASARRAAHCRAGAASTCSSLPGVRRGPRSPRRRAARPRRASALRAPRAAAHNLRLGAGATGSVPSEPRAQQPPSCSSRCPRRPAPGRSTGPRRTAAESAPIPRSRGGSCPVSMWERWTRRI